ncbi:MAG TPA: hypothetical protein VGV09_01220 [Steroidobacteraceae bacterium]|nr:hypothetical protein [Steroidobacteraceae bacterium]
MAQRAAAAQPAESAASQDAQSLAEVLVTAAKLPRETLKRIASQFVKSHAAVNPVIHQIGRWSTALCPRVTGLKPAASAFVMKRVTGVARSIGAPASQVGKGCPVNLEIVFTAEPQQLLNHIAKAYPSLLGSSRTPGDAIARRAVQSWYTTGTKAPDGWSPPIGDEAAMAVLQMGVDMSTPPGGIARDGARVDPAYGEGFAGFGRPGSYFTQGLSSEFLQVLVIVDSGKIAQDSLSSVADYVAMLALTRVNLLDGCSELPSILDLLSSGCGQRQKPAGLTDTDTAYLKALYASDLEKRLNLEQGDIRDRMVTAIAGR